MIKKCKVCENLFDDNNKNVRIYCSKICLGRSKNRRKSNIPLNNSEATNLICNWCNKKFSGSRARVKFCSQECQQKYHTKNNLKNIQDIRNKIFEIYGKTCECCGEDNLEFLTCDHVDGGGNQHRQEKSQKKIFEEILESYGDGRFRVLCMNCNWATRFGKQCPHKKYINRNVS
ncbi:MAG TPA: hypothetical protein VFV86_10860 [Nitrososphaeraceae archaeon]|nr:hypothetical protein [Nitrososphaeraceae archaeon]